MRLRCELLLSFHTNQSQQFSVQSPCIREQKKRGLKRDAQPKY